MYDEPLDSSFKPWLEAPEVQAAEVGEVPDLSAHPDFSDFARDPSFDPLYLYYIYNNICV